MTRPTTALGDKGQRFEIRYADADDTASEQVLGYASTQEKAEGMAASWRKHPEGYLVWVVDREMGKVVTPGNPAVPTAQG